MMNNCNMRNVDIAFLHGLPKKAETFYIISKSWCYKSDAWHVISPSLIIINSYTVNKFIQPVFLTSRLPERFS